MQVLEEIKVSVYENVYSKKPKIMSFLEVIFMCIHPVYASIIQSIRRYHQEGDHEAAQKLKSQLPCFTPAGTFDGAHARFRESRGKAGAFAPARRFFLLQVCSRGALIQRPARR